ncbi:hypothetical protein CQ001_09975 [Erwinia billingiae]|jgi:hypothetical protein|nr:hypothetical protein CQ001_09975 [Erwinia billingiae]
MRSLTVALSVCLMLFIDPAFASNSVSDGWEWLKDDVSQTWEQPEYHDLYLPFMQVLFGTAALPFRYWVITLIIGFVMFLIVEIEKPLTRKFRTA